MIMPINIIMMNIMIMIMIMIMMIMRIDTCKPVNESGVFWKQSSVKGEELEWCSSSDNENHHHCNTINDDDDDDNDHHHCNIGQW